MIGSENGTVEVFNMQSGIKRKRFVEGHTRSVTFVGMDKLNKTLVSAGSDGLVIVVHLPYRTNCSCGISRQRR